MQTRSRNTFLTLHTEGALLPADLLQRLLDGDKDLGTLVLADDHLDKVALQRSQEHLEVHRHVRKGSKVRNERDRVEAQLPPDVLRIDFYLPIGK